MSKENNKQEEEIELGSLFVIIGKGFTKLFNFIGSIFKGLFHFIILILLFLKANTIKIGIAVLIGVLIGAYLELDKETRYGADLQVQPNFESSRQLYNNINFYNDLVKQKDTILLAKTFKISVSEASTLKKFDIFPVKNENDIITSYDELILSVDTLTVKSYSFDNFKRMFTDYDYKIHKVTVQATKNDVFSKLDDVIISSITENKYFNKLKELNNENLNRTDAMLRKNLAQADSLHNVYKKVLVEEAKKETSGTSIDMGGNGRKSAKELELFESKRKISKDLKDIIEEKSEKSEVVNIISNFQSVGYEIKGIQKNYAFQLGLLGAGIVISILLLLQLNNYLNNYKK